MSDLMQVYKGRVLFEILSATSPEGQAATKRNGWDDALHGLEAVAPDGRVTGHLPGHDYGREQIVEQVEALLKASPR